jgi:chemosensory pili system protein ChpA (sensor histidine kinase/response regulator)
VARVSKSEVQKHLAEDVPTFNYGGQVYRLQHLGAFVGGGPSALPELDVSVPLILIRAGDHSTAIVTDELVGSREMVVKSVGPQIATIRGIAGATILGDGRIVIILDMGALVRSDWRGGKAPLESQGPKLDKRTFVLVVDDSITVRRVTQRLLERNGMRVMTAKDGIDALSIRTGDAGAGGCAPHRYSDRDDHVARRRETSRSRHRNRRQRLPRQTVSGKPAARRHRTAGAGA